MRQALFEARVKVKLTQEQVAQKAGIDRTIYNKIERGRIKTVPVELALKIAKIVKGPVDHIFLISDSHQKHKTKAG